MQSNLKALFAGRREAVRLSPKRGPGRPKKKREAPQEKDEGPDEVLQALHDNPHQYDDFNAALPMRGKKRKHGAISHVDSLSEALGTEASEMRMPGRVEC